MLTGSFLVFQIKISVYESSKPLKDCTLNYGTISINGADLFLLFLQYFSFPEIRVLNDKNGSHFDKFSLLT